MPSLIIVSSQESVHAGAAETCRRWDMPFQISSLTSCDSVPGLGYEENLTVVLLDQQFRAQWTEYHYPVDSPNLYVILLVDEVTSAGYRDAFSQGFADVIAYNDLDRLPTGLSRIQACYERGERRQIAELRTALENISRAVILLDMDTTIRIFNRQAAEFNRQFYGIETRVGVRLIDLMPETAQAMFRERFDAALSGQPITVDVRLRDGLHDFSFEFLPVRSTDNRVSGVTIIYEDITERKTFERQFQLFSSVYQTMTDAVIVTDLEYKVVAWNAAAEKLYGWRADDVIGRSVGGLLQTEFESIEAVQQSQTTLSETGKWEAPNVVQHRRDGTPIWVSTTVTLLKDSKGVPHSIVACNQDITEQHHAEQALRAALAREHELNTLKTRFVSMASHEFRTPLATILTAAETVSIYRHRMMNSQIDERLDRIRQQVLHMTGIIEDVLQLTRLEADHVPLRMVYADYAAFCRDIAAGIESGASENRRLALNGAHAPIYTHFDQRLMRQAITNVITNALKYSPPETRVELTLKQENEHILLDVRDYGIGIPEDELPRLFEPFHRATNVGAISGTGLGLSITKQAIDRHGGSITIQSAPDHGTTVTLMIPVILTSASGDMQSPPMG